MCKSRFTEHKVISILKAVEAGRTVREVCREQVVSEATKYNWRSNTAVWKQLIFVVFEEENRPLKQVFADLCLENCALKDVIKKKL